MDPMKTVLLGPPTRQVEELIARRKALGQDRYDEVWQGEYHLAPAAHPWHGRVQRVLAMTLEPLAARVGLVGTESFNLGQPDDYRVPDGGFHWSLPQQTWVPTAAIVVEVVSPDDETWAKFGFYARHGVEEVGVADPMAGVLRWFRLAGDGYEEVDASALLGVTVADVAAQVDWPQGTAE